MISATCCAISPRRPPEDTLFLDRLDNNAGSELLESFVGDRFLDAHALVGEIKHTVGVTPNRKPVLLVHQLAESLEFRILSFRRLRYDLPLSTDDLKILLVDPDFPFKKPGVSTLKPLFSKN